jgi:hypothetical protein
MHAERRLPSAEEATISAAEFARYFGVVAGSQANPEPVAEALNQDRGRH